MKEYHSDILKKKTLLVDKDDLDEKLTEEEITQVYPYKYKIVSHEEFDKSIIELDTASVIAQILVMSTSVGDFSLFTLHETNTGKMVGSGLANKSGVLKAGPSIKKKQFKNFAEIANSK